MVKRNQKSEISNQKNSVAWVWCLALAGLFLFSFVEGLWADDTEKCLLLELSPKTIAMPENKASKVPIRAIRIRSEELRALNTQYNAVSVERVYKLKDKKSTQSMAPDTRLMSREAPYPKNRYRHPQGSKEGQREANILDPVGSSNMFSRELKEQLEVQKEETKEVEDVFLITFKSGEPINMGQLISAYSKLDVVVYAEAVQ